MADTRMNGHDPHDPRKIREMLGVDQTVLLSPQQPVPQIEDGSLLQVLTHNGVFSPQDCVKAFANNDKDWITSVVQTSASEEEGTEKTDVRNSSNIWVSRKEENIWLFDKMLALTMAANKLFKFEVDFFEALQLARYQEGQFYGWHADLGPGQMGNRKLGITVQLSEPDSYEGGDLVLDDNGRDFFAPRELGSVTVFPSFMKHKVTPVTKGTRYSLVAWASGTLRFR
jgi:PKHD-type hydroxylase